jgi:L-rhamnose mutarotase
MNTKRFCLTLDMKNDPELIAEYKEHHERIWPEVYKSIRDSGILEMEIYLLGNRLFMIMETEKDFSFDKKSAQDADNPKVVEWEELMWKYQQPLPGSMPGEKWKLMVRIFCLNEQAGLR